MSTSIIDFPEDLANSPENIRGLRLKAEITKPEAAAAAGVKPVTWVAYESGKIRMPAERWIGFKQCIRSGAFKAFVSTGRRLGPKVNPSFVVGGLAREYDEPVVNGGALLREARQALSMNAAELASLVGYDGPSWIFVRERGDATVTADVLKQVLRLLNDREKELVGADLRIAAKEDLTSVLGTLRITHATLAEGVPTGIQEERKAIFHLISGRLKLSDEIIAHLMANVRRIHKNQIQALMTAISRIEAVLNEGQAC